MAQAKKQYRPPTTRQYSVRDLWRELGPAQALTSVAPPGGAKPDLPSNPLRIPPANK